jgi:hypothetical protein
MHTPKKNTKIYTKCCFYSSVHSNCSKSSIQFNLSAAIQYVSSKFTHETKYCSSPAYVRLASTALTSYFCKNTSSLSKYLALGSRIGRAYKWKGINSLQCCTFSHFSNFSKRHASQQQVAFFAQPSPSSSLNLL